MAGLQVFGQPASTDVARVLTCLFEKNRKFELVRADKFNGQPNVPEFIKLQASYSISIFDISGQVTFKDGDLTLTNSRAIIRHVATKYEDEGNKALYGKGALDRALIEQWLQSEALSFARPSSALIFHLAFAEPLGIHPDEAVIEQNEKKLSAILDIYNKRLGDSKYLAGDSFTLADLSHLPNSHYLVTLSKRGQELFTERKNVERWWNAISTRPSWKEVFGSPTSTEVARVLMCLFEKDVEFQLIRVDTYKGQKRMPDYLKLQPHGQALTFEDGKLTLVDSREICRHIAGRNHERGNKELFGTCTLERAAIEQWLQTEAHSFGPPSSELVFNLAFAPLMGQEKDEKAVVASERKLGEVLDIYERRLAEDEYLAGHKFTLADLSHVPNAHRLGSIPACRSLFASMANVNRWWKQITNRPAWRKVVAMQQEPAPVI
ncbi:Glutathione S-transferase F8, chloroplastic [Ananas comosus]|uniref:glutathione transferase n=1 Tax=Ananas comosus TaxID=4615 RepID=A0A199UP89_ANACO|nr:Glutathione S-transferase F8, chloroplastic [Ananas comosus]